MGVWKKELTEACQRLSDLSHGGVSADARPLLRIQAEVLEIEHLLRDVEVPRLHRPGHQCQGREDKVRLADLTRAMVCSDDM